MRSEASCGVGKRARNRMGSRYKLKVGNEFVRVVEMHVEQAQNIAEDVDINFDEEKTRCTVVNVEKN